MVLRCSQQSIGYHDRATAEHPYNLIPLNFHEQRLEDFS